MLLERLQTLVNMKLDKQECQGMFLDWSKFKTNFLQILLNREIDF